MIRIKLQKSNHSRGITLFIAIIATSILLLISTAIANLAYKGLVFSGLVQNSQSAFYAADGGAECAMYWDFKDPSGNSAFSTSSPLHDFSCFRQMLHANISAEISQTVNLNPSPPSSYGDGTTTINFADPNCSTITIAKYYPDKTQPLIKTKIESKGYNTCVSSNPKRLERAIRISY